MIADVIRRLFLEQGFPVVGFAPSDPAPGQEAEFLQWLARGYHGTMTYLEGHAESKYRPENLLPGARTVIVAAFPYFQKEIAGREIGDGGSDGKALAGPAGRVSVYAWGRDYHKVVGGRLKHIRRELEAMYPEEQFRSFVDTLPLGERHYAAMAGVGFIGRNTLLITREYGSWVFLSGFLTTMRVTPTATDAKNATDADGATRQCPPDCTRCIDACPTGALFAPFRIDASRCISYRTIERKSPDPGDHPGGWGEEETDRRSGSWMFGCDLCQQVCPFNARARETIERDFRSWIAGPSIPLGEIEEIADEEQFVQRFAGSPLMRAGITGMKRNARIVRSNEKPGSGNLL